MDSRQLQWQSAVATDRRLLLPTAAASGRTPAFTMVFVSAEAVRRRDEKRKGGEGEKYRSPGELLSQDRYQTEKRLDLLIRAYGSQPEYPNHPVAGPAKGPWRIAAPLERNTPDRVAGLDQKE